MYLHIILIFLNVTITTLCVTITTLCDHDNIYCFIIKSYQPKYIHNYALVSVCSYDLSIHIQSTLIATFKVVSSCYILAIAD